MEQRFEAWHTCSHSQGNSRVEAVEKTEHARHNTHHYIHPEAAAANHSGAKGGGVGVDRERDTVWM